jgi:hypothetical protein
MKSLAMLRAAGFLLLAPLVSSQLNAGHTLCFFAFGDLPYSAAEDELLMALLADVSQEEPEFLVHVGDLKSGMSPCTARALGRMAQLFKEQAVPVVYTPGDNDWTDCHRPEAGGYDPLERLAVLRPLYYGDDDVLRLSELRISRENTAYPENYWFVVEGVFFATVHVVGSHNNLNRGNADAMDEAMARLRSNREHLRAAVDAANAAHASAFVLLLHANPGFEMPVPPPGYDLFREDLAALLRDYSGPVLAVHGDTHSYRYDHPLRDPETGRAIQRFTRLEVPGSPLVGGVWVCVDPDAAEPFAVELTYPDSREQLIER